jgi:PAS domain S-box-containing protein
LDVFYRSLLGALIAHMQDGVLAESEAGTVIVANAAFARLCGVESADELIGSSATLLRERVWRVLVTDIDAHRAQVAELRRRREPHLDFELTLADGRVFDRDYVPVPAPDGTVVHMWHYRDVTERRQMERRLRESSARLRALSAALEDAREEERRQVARTLHDELGQLFSSIRLELGAAIAQFRQCPTPGLAGAIDRLQAAAGLTDIGVASLRRLTTALRPPVLDHLGLVAAIRWEASLFSKRTGIRCHVRAQPSAIALDEVRTTALYRILVAALDNIARHAGAGTTWIALSRSRGVTVMEVRDNGRGITEEQINGPNTMGLLGMRERAIALGGELRVTGARRRGTTVTVIVPDAPPKEGTRVARTPRTRAHA